MMWVLLTAEPPAEPIAVCAWSENTGKAMSARKKVVIVEGKSVLLFPLAKGIAVSSEKVTFCFFLYRHDFQCFTEKCVVSIICYYVRQKYAKIVKWQNDSGKKIYGFRLPIGTTHTPSGRLYAKSPLATTIIRNEGKRYRERTSNACKKRYT